AEPSEIVARQVGGGVATIGDPELEVEAGRAVATGRAGCPLRSNGGERRKRAADTGKHQCEAPISGYRFHSSEGDGGVVRTDRGRGRADLVRVAPRASGENVRV